MAMSLRNFVWKIQKFIKNLCLSACLLRNIVYSVWNECARVKYLFDFYEKDNEVLRGSCLKFEKVRAIQIWLEGNDDPSSWDEDIFDELPENIRYISLRMSFAVRGFICDGVCCIDLCLSTCSM
jgi:hypothetical protein